MEGGGEWRGGEWRGGSGGGGVEGGGGSGGGGWRGGGEWRGGGGQTMGVLWGTGIGQFFFSIRKQHSVDKVHTLRYSVSKISEYKLRCCFFLLF